MRKFFAMALFLSGTLVFTSCSDDDDEPSDAEVQQAALDAVSAAVAGKVSTDESATGADESVFGWTLTKGGDYNTDATEREIVSGNITEDMTFTSDKIWEIQGRVAVINGATLTIEAGTRVEGATEVDGTVLQGVDASVLMIAKGSKINAIGTADEPIIMTATDEENGAATTRGKWGGLVVLGNAPISAETSPAQIEGVPASDANGLYGGSNASDNSGTISYVSIRHGGAIIDADAGDEINGLTLGGVGSGTTITNIEIYANSDDGVEFFGGTVNVTNVVVNQVGDDGLDIDQSYAGTITNYLVWVGDSDEGLEIDGREGDMKASFKLVNGTIEAVGGASVHCDFKSKAMGSVTNLNANGGKIKLDASFDDAFESTENAAQNVVDGTLTFSTVNATWEVYTDDLPALLEE